jgi:hypothetical protein
MAKTEISVFGCGLTLDVTASLVTVDKLNDNEVIIRMRSQTLKSAQYTLNVKEKYGKTADEFIKEFENILVKLGTPKENQAVPFPGRTPIKGNEEAIASLTNPDGSINLDDSELIPKGK